MAGEDPMHPVRALGSDDSPELVHLVPEMADAQMPRNEALQSATESRPGFGAHGADGCAQAATHGVRDPLHAAPNAAPPNVSVVASEELVTTVTRQSYFDVLAR